MALGAGESFPNSTHATDADGRVLVNITGGGSATGGAALGDTTANPTTTGQAAYGFVFNGTTWDRVRAGNNNGVTLGAQAVSPSLYDTGQGKFFAAQNASGDASAVGAASLLAGTLPYGMVATSTADRLRTPNVFKSFASTAITAGTGATVWTPAAGKKFRVMGWAISSSVAGVIILGDNAAGTVIARSPAVAAAGFFQLGAADMGNGILSAAANNVLKVDGPTGNVAGMVWGTEE